MAVFHDGPMAQRAPATQLWVTPRNVTGVLDGLEADEPVARTAHPSVRRAALVSLTDSRHALTASLREGRDFLATALFGNLPAARLTVVQDGTGGGDRSAARRRSPVGADIHQQADIMSAIKRKYLGD